MPGKGLRRCQGRPGSLKDDKKPVMGRAGGRVLQLEELHGGGKPLARSGKDGGKTGDWSAVSRLGRLGRRAGGPRPTERQDGGGLAAA